MNLPNKISMIRLFMTPIMLAVFLLDAIPLNEFIAGIIFFVASITDGIDGSIARKYNMVTTLGKFLDSIADKVLCATAMVLIVYASSVEFLAVYIALMVCLTIARELLVSVLRQVAAGKNVIMAADKWGKVKAVFQYIAIPLLMIADDFSGLVGMDTVYLYTVAFVLFAISVLFAIFSTVNYLYKNRKVFSED